MRKLLTTNYSLQTHRGFTLIEMLISITLFMLFLGLVASSYTQLVKANGKAKDIQSLYDSVRFVFDTLASEIRTGSLDFTCLDPAQLDPLCLENQSGSNQKIIGVLHEKGLVRSIYKFDDTQKKILVLRQTRASTSFPWSLGNWESITPENFPLEDFSFRVFPLKNPYAEEHAADDNAQYQPSVTINLATRGFSFRTTYSSRTYGKQNIYE